MHWPTYLFKCFAPRWVLIRLPKETFKIISLDFQDHENDLLLDTCFYIIFFRRFFAKLEAPNDRGRYLQELLNSFAVRFCQCNPHLGYSVGKNNYIIFIVNYVNYR